MGLIVTRAISKIAIVIIAYNPIKVLITLHTKSDDPPSSG